MKPFSAPIDDMMFCLEAAAQVGSLDDWDHGFAAEIAGHFAAFAEGEIAPIDEPGDIQGCQLENGVVSMPDGFRDVYQSYCEQGWPGLTAPEEFGGQGMGPIMLALTTEIYAGACHALQMVVGLAPGAIRTIARFGTDDQKARLLPPLVSGEWIPTMCLTEPGAGSDLARIRCRATKGDDGWTISGEKIFISGGDQDISDGVLHLVLARTSDDGLRGLSLFVCQGRTVEGRASGVSVTRIEEKMGLHASPTCQMLFENARAELIGKEGGGLTAMFTMMNQARADVALQGVAHAARAFDIASTYASERVQGRNSAGEPAKLNEHADIIRMLERMDGLAMGGRALAHLSMVALEGEQNPDLVEFLTPLTKAFCTDAAIEAANLGIQVLGGYGYLREYRIDQVFRDARITAIYEGANGIHERMLATRLLKTGSAAAFEALVRGEIDMGGSSSLAAVLESWQAARAYLEAAEDPTTHAHDFAKLTAMLAMELLWGRMAAAAERHSDPARIKRLAGVVTGENAIFAPAYAKKICG